MKTGIPEAWEGTKETLPVVANTLIEEIPQLSSKMTKVLDDAIEKEDNPFVKSVLLYAKGVKNVSDSYTVDKYANIVENCIKKKDDDSNYSIQDIKSCIESFKDLAESYIKA